MDEYIGTIKIFGFTFAPRGWQTCQGQTLSIAQNSALFSLLGTTYGGNGQTTFQLPNLGGRVPVGAGQSPGTGTYVIGQIGGAESATLTTNNMPMHTHGATATSTSTTTAILQAENAAATAQNPNGKCLASGTTIYADTDAQQMRQMAPGCVNATTTTNTTVTLAPAGGSQPFDLHTPYLCVNYSICLEGVFPSRN